MTVLRSRFGLIARNSTLTKTPILGALAEPAAAANEGVAVLRLLDPIDSWGGEWGTSASEFIAALGQLPEETREIRLHINSPGGEVFEGLTILNSLRDHPARVVAIVDGIAASAASVVAIGVDELAMAPSTSLMLHDAWGLCMGNAADMRKLAETLDHVSDNIAAVYARKAGGTTQQWRDIMRDEAWYNPDEAVEARLADRVHEPAVAVVKDAYDLSAFRYAGRDQAPPPPQPTGAAESGPADETPTTDLAAWAERRHRMNARKYGFPAA